MNKIINSKFVLRSAYYLTWFIANFFICLLPILIAALINSKVENIIAGYLGFIFTRLVGSLYVFNSKRNEETFDQLILWTTFLFTLVCLLCLPLYSTVDIVTTFFNSFPSQVIIYSLILTIILCTILNRKVIENKVSERYNLIILSRNPGRTAQDFQDIKATIEKSQK